MKEKMADKEMFSYWVTQPELLEKPDVEKLELLIAEYPYFQLAHMLLAKAVSIGQPESLSRYLPKAAVCSLNRKALQLLVENDMEWSVDLLNRLTRTRPRSVDTAEPVSPVDPPVVHPLLPGRQNDSGFPYDPTVLAEFAMAREFDHMAEKPGEEKSKTRVQELIERFINTAPVIGSLTSDTHPQGEPEDLSLRGQAVLEDFATESFAEILVKQGKVDRAIGIYEKLILKIPEKKDYFAKKIEGLR